MVITWKFFLEVFCTTGVAGLGWTLGCWVMARLLGVFTKQ